MLVAAIQLIARSPEVSIISIIDILFVAVLIYQFLVLIRGTRAAPMLVGLGVLALAFYLARVWGLTTVIWLVSTLLPYAIFALIVVFIAEIRHALARLGRKLTFSRLSSRPTSESYDDI